MPSWHPALPALAQQKDPAAAPTAAPVGKISGRVTEGGKGPFAFANVVVLGSKQGTATDENRNFVLAGVPVGTAQVQVQAIGYDKMVKTVQVNAGGNSVVNFELGAQKSVKQLEEIEVRAGEADRHEILRHEAEYLGGIAPGAARRQLRERGRDQGRRRRARRRAALPRRSWRRGEIPVRRRRGQ